MRHCLFDTSSPCKRPGTMAQCIGIPVADTIYWRSAQRLMAFYSLAWAHTCPPNRDKGLLMGGIVLCDRPDHPWAFATFAHEVGHYLSPLEARMGKDRLLPFLRWEEALVWSIAKWLTEQLGLEWDTEMERNRQESLCILPDPAIKGGRPCLIK